MPTITPAELREFGKLEDDSDEFLQTFIDRAENFCLRLASIDSLPTKTGDSNVVDPEFRGGVLTYALFLYETRDFPRPQLEEAVNKQVMNQIAGQTNFADRLILTETSEGVS